MAANAPEKQKKSLTWRNIEGKGDLANIKEIRSWRNEALLNKPPINEPMPTIVKGMKGILYLRKYSTKNNKYFTEAYNVVCQDVDDVGLEPGYTFYEGDKYLTYTFLTEYGKKWLFRPEADPEGLPAAAQEDAAAPKGAAAQGGQRRSRKTRRRHQRRSRKTRR